MEKDFFILFSPEGTTAPVQVHASHKEAHAIAHVMAKRNPGHTFFVMRKSGRPIRYVSPVAEATEPEAIAA